MKKIGIIGFGAVCENAHVPAMKKLSSLIKPVCVFDLDQARCERARELLGVNAYTGIDQMFEKESLDMVVITTPPSTHKDIIIKSLKNGMDVLSEKPLCVSLKEFDEISDAVYSTGRIVYTVHNWLYSEHMLKIFSLLNDIGDIKHISWKTLRKKPSVSASSNWRVDPKISGGGIIFDHGWHVIYLMSEMLKKKFKYVNSGFLFNEKAVDEIADIQIISENDATVDIHLSWHSPIRKNTMLIYGTKGVLLFDDDRITISYDSEKQFEYMFNEKLSGSSSHPEWTEYVYSDFLNAIIDRSKFEKNFEQSRECLKIITLAYKNYEQRKNKVLSD
ncbi:MAG: Gfo/Idh/MocA family oxidoreductase [Elusimicrobiales bacterium]|nr:Gfo/Idh/MocA family oxidoreductase [Elusimicrobiales bacterium]